MTGPEHYREAERLLAIAGMPKYREGAQQLLAEAQVHATLALVAATAVVSDDEQQWRDAYGGGDAS